MFSSLPVSIHVDLVGNKVEFGGKNAFVSARHFVAAIVNTSQNVDNDVQVLLGYLKTLTVYDTVN